MEVERSEGDSSINLLVLNNVLPVPDAFCNVFNPQSPGGGMSFKDYGAQGFDQDHQPMWYAKKYCGLLKVVLAGNPEGVSPLQEACRGGSVVLVSLHLTDEDEGNIQRQAAG